MNLAYFNNIVIRIDNLTARLNVLTGQLTLDITETNSCSGLAALSVQVVEELGVTSAQLANIANQANTATTDISNEIDAALVILGALQVAPTNLAELLTWATALTQTYIGPYETYLANQIVVAAQITRIADAVASCATSIANAENSLSSAITQKQQKIGCI